MTVVVDASLAVAVLNPDDAFHEVALRSCIRSENLSILNLTRAEALIHPARSGHLKVASGILDDLGMVTEPVTNDVADCARDLRVKYGNRHFPVLDAIVVSYGVVHGCPIITCDAKWPEIAETEIVVLKPE